MKYLFLLLYSTIGEQGLPIDWNFFSSLEKILIWIFHYFCSDRLRCSKSKLLANQAVLAVFKCLMFCVNIITAAPSFM